jgi:copper chaperone CopZ
MKSLALFSTLFIALLAFSSTNAQTKNLTIKVWGNCGMCKAKIEKAAKSADAKKAKWDAEKQELAVSFDEATTSSEKIQQAIAKVGYDTQDFKGDDAAYSKLAGCCKYERKTESPEILKTN